MAGRNPDRRTFVERQRHRERVAIEAALRKHGKFREAAAALGMPKSTLFDRALALGIEIRRSAP